MRLLLLVAAFVCCACKPRLEPTSGTAGFLPADVPPRYLVLETSVDAPKVFHGTDASTAWVPTIKSQIATLTLGIDGRVERVRDEAHLLELLANEAKSIPANGSLVLALGAHGAPNGLEYEKGKLTSLSEILVAMTDARIEAKLPPLKRLVLLVVACYAGSQDDGFDLTDAPPVDAAIGTTGEPPVDAQAVQMAEGLAAQVEAFSSSRETAPSLALNDAPTGDAALFEEAIALYITSESTPAYLNDFRSAFARTMADLPFDATVDQWAAALTKRHKASIAGAFEAAKTTATPRKKSDPMLIRYHPAAKAASIREGFLLPDARVAYLRSHGAVQVGLPSYTFSTRELVGGKSYTLPAKLDGAVYRPVSPPKPSITPRSVSVDQIVDPEREAFAALLASGPNALFHVQVYRDASGAETHRVRYVSRP